MTHEHDPAVRRSHGRPWAIVTAGSVATVMSAPGQTAAIAVFTDPLIDELDITRNALSTSYMVATLLGACALPFIGRALDRYGIGRVMVAIGLVFGAVLVALSLVTEIIGLTLGFIGVRMVGQGALGLAASTAVAVHITRRRGLAIGIKTAVGSAGIAMAPVLLEWMIRHLGMSTVWLIEGLLVWAVVIPVALYFRRLPRPLVEPERSPSSGSISAVAPQLHWTASQAVRAPMFWIITAGVAASGMLGTGLQFHQIAALGERGLSPTEAAANFVPQAVAMLVVTIGVGGLADRLAPKVAVAASMLLLAGSMAFLTLVTDPWTGVIYGALLGASGGAVRTVEAASFARYFGTLHLGAIRGIVTTVAVGSTAFGPVMLSLGLDLVGSYALTAAILAAIPVVVGVAALFAPEPDRQGQPTG
ncbi:MFS transporter [Nesterenkonia xinjiangensis]|uniref:MFS family permease n=1 Tax=Nesterenkonia xinjiangensis TaxID=225327 RepID=A0A7Z0GK72_9MICC|nr:MFS family permease [Nesterenkonia xinjiangensis]